MGAFLMCIIVVCCAGSDDCDNTIRAYSIENPEDIIPGKNITFDSEVTWDGNGSCRINSKSQGVINLFETGDIDVENAVLIYKARIKSKEFDGKAFLQMWVFFCDGSRYFSRGLDFAVSGTRDWFLSQTPFFLKEGENPVNIKLQIVVAGAGTLWIDDVRLICQ